MASNNSENHCDALIEQQQQQPMQDIQYAQQKQHPLAAIAAKASMAAEVQTRTPPSDAREQREIITAISTEASPRISPSPPASPSPSPSPSHCSRSPSVTIQHGRTIGSPVDGLSMARDAALEQQGQVQRLAQLPQPQQPPYHEGMRTLQQHVEHLAMHSPSTPATPHTPQTAASSTSLGAQEGSAAGHSQAHSWSTPGMSQTPASNAPPGAQQSNMADPMSSGDSSQAGRDPINRYVPLVRRGRPKKYASEAEKRAAARERHKERRLMSRLQSSQDPIRIVNHYSQASGIPASPQVASGRFPTLVPAPSPSRRASAQNFPIPVQPLHPSPAHPDAPLAGHGNTLEDQLRGRFSAYLARVASLLRPDDGDVPLRIMIPAPTDLLAACLFDAACTLKLLERRLELRVLESRPSCAGAAFSLALLERLRRDSAQFGARHASDGVRVLIGPDTHAAVFARDVDLVLVEADRVTAAGDVRARTGAGAAVITAQVVAPEAHVVVASTSGRIDGALRKSDPLPETTEVASVSAAWDKMLVPMLRDPDFTSLLGVSNVPFEWIDAHFVTEYLMESGSVKVGQIAEAAARQRRRLDDLANDRLVSDVLGLQQYMKSEESIEVD